MKAIIPGRAVDGKGLYAAQGDARALATSAANAT
jgi:hypothetical protein